MAETKNLIPKRRFKEFQNTSEQKKKEELIKSKIKKSQFLSIKEYVVNKLKSKNCV